MHNCKIFAQKNTNKNNNKDDDETEIHKSIFRSSECWFIEEYWNYLEIPKQIAKCLKYTFVRGCFNIPGLFTRGY